jgi:hypothetical protein
MATLNTTAGYRRLDSWVMANIIQLGTDIFCEKFLSRKMDPTGRQYDQMTQAARSGKANIVEGSARAGTSKETEMRLTDVAKASLDELSSDYEKWLLKKGLAPWHRNSAEAKEILSIRFDKPHFGEDWIHDSCVHILEQQKKFERWILSDNDVVVANCLRNCKKQIPLPAQYVAVECICEKPLLVEMQAKNFGVAVIILNVKA